MLHHIHHQRTVAIIRVLKSLGGVRRRGGRMPKMQLPDLIGLEYFKAIAPFACGLARQAFDRVEGQVLRLIAEEAEEVALLGPRGDRLDAGRRQSAKELVDRAAKAAVEGFRPKERDIKKIAAGMGKRTDDFNRNQIDRQSRAVLGIPLSSLERPSKLDVEGFAALNVELISTVPERYFDRLRQDIVDAFEKGTATDKVAKQFAKRYDISLDDAMRIARDQIGKLNAQVNAERQQALGITRFTWITMRDQNVCEFCFDLDGSVFEYAEPPECMPGECHPLDRCYAQADYSSLVDAIEEE